MARRHRTPEESFDARTMKSEATGCWLWTGYVDPKGYGVIGVGNRRLMKAHRYSYERFKEAIPAGMQLDHLCRVRHCVNPEHLEPVTNRENVVRGNAARPKATHCKHGHEFTTGNTYFHPKRGTRHCRACQNQRSAR